MILIFPTYSWRLRKQLFESVYYLFISKKVINFGSWFLLQNDNTLCSRLRNTKVEDLRSLTNFFGSCTETFVLAVNILDRFLALMKVFNHFYKYIFIFLYPVPTTMCIIEGFNKYLANEYNYVTIYKYF